MIGKFFHWWTSQLRALLPFSTGNDGGQWLNITVDADRIRGSLNDQRDELLLDVARVQADEVQAELRRVAQDLDPGRVRCRVWVDMHEVLARELELPLAAEENLREVLTFEMARKTPFRAQDVHFDAQVTARDPARRVLTVQLNVVPRRSLGLVMDALADWSLEAISAAGAARVAQRRQQAVFAFRSAGYAQRSFTGLNLLLGCAVLALGAACVWLPIDAQRRTLEQLQAQAQRARAEAGEAMVLRDEFDTVQRASSFLANAQSARPAMVQVLEELSRALPDNTFLSRLQVNAGEVNLHGSSQAASELIAILEQLDLLESVRFASPVTRDAASGGERFHIVARLAGRTIAPPPAARRPS